MKNPTKICSKCTNEKILDEFYFIKQENRYNKRCKNCINIYNKKSYDGVKLLPKITVETKICSQCKFEKNIKEFNKERKQKDGYNNSCKECVKIQQSKFRLKYNPKQIFKPNHKICNCCKDELHFDNFYPLKLGKFGLHNNCKICCSKKFKEWQNKNGKDWENKYRKERKKTDIQFKLKCLLRGRINDALKKGKVTKRHSSLKILDCGLDFYKEYLQNQFLPVFTWENHGIVWEIDHIEPCSSFDLTKDEEVKKCFHYTNTMPRFKTTEIAQSFGYPNHIGNRDKGDKIL